MKKTITNFCLACLPAFGFAQNVGIGTITPASRLQVNFAGLYTRAEALGHNLELHSGTTSDHVLYLGADAANQLNYIQSVGGGGFRELLLQGRGGAVVVGKDARSTLSVMGDVVVDYNSANTGTTEYSLLFGGTAVGEGIRSKRNATGNQFGLDFFTNYVSRMSITNTGDVVAAGNVSVQNNKGIIRNNSATQLKQVITNVVLDYSGVPNTIASQATVVKNVTWSEAFLGSPTAAYLGNVGVGGSFFAELVISIFEVTSTGCKVFLYNPKPTGVNPNFNINLIAVGQ